MGTIDKGPAYYKTYYAVQAFIIGLSEDHQPPQSTYSNSPLSVLTEKVTDLIYTDIQQNKE